MDDIPNEVIDRIFYFFKDFAQLCKSKIVCQRFHATIRVAELNWLRAFFVKVITKLCLPQNPMCKGYLLEKLYNDALIYWKVFESSQEKLFILIKDAKIMLHRRSNIQTSFCILFEWIPSNEINLFSTLRTLIVFRNITKARHLAVTLNQREAVLKLSTSRKWFTKKSENAWLQTIPLLSNCTTSINPMNPMNPSLDNFFKILDQSRVNNRFQNNNFRNSGDFTFFVNQLPLSTKQREYLFNIVDTQEELDLLVKSDLRGSVVSVFFPFPYAFHSTEKIRDLFLESKIPLKLSHLTEKLSFDELKFLFLIFFPDVSPCLFFFRDYDRLLLSMIECADNFKSMALKYEWLKPFFAIYEFEYSLFSLSIKTLMMPFETFKNNFPHIAAFFESRDSFHIGKILCLWAKDKLMWPLICKHLDLDFWNSKLLVRLIYQMIIVSDTLQHYEILSKLIFSDLPRNFNTKAKEPFRCVKRDLIPLIKNLSTLQSLETAKTNLKFYQQNFHKMKTVGSKVVIKCIKFLFDPNFIDFWVQRLN